MRRFFGPILVLLAASTVLLGCGEDQQVTAEEPDAAGDSITLTASVPDATSEQLAAVERVLLARLDALGLRGVAEVVGSTVQIEVPAEDEKLARASLAVVGQLEFRPLLAAVGQVLDAQGREEAEVRVEELRESLGLPDGITAQHVYEDGLAATTTADELTNKWGVDVGSEEFSELAGLEMQLRAEVTPPADRFQDAEVTLTMEDGLAYRLGPVVLGGSAVEQATAELSTQGQWTVSPVFRAGSDGIDRFNEIAAVCYAGGATCPDLGGGNGQLAIVLDDEILSAPTIQQPTFNRDQIQISGSFDEQSARLLAVALSTPSPVRWIPVD